MIMHDFSRSSQRVVSRMSKVKRITWAKVYRWKQCDYAIAASMTPPFPLFNLYAFGRSRATLLTMTPRREQHQTCSSRSSIKNKTVSTQRTWEHWVQLESKKSRKDEQWTIITLPADLTVSADPRTVITDFEQAAMNALANVLGPQVEVRGCFFHFCQSTWRKIQDLGECHFMLFW